MKLLLKGSKKSKITKKKYQFCNLGTCKYSLFKKKKILNFLEQRRCLWYLNKSLPFGLNDHLHYVFKSILNKKFSILAVENLNFFFLLLVDKLRKAVNRKVLHQFNSDFDGYPNKNFLYLKNNLRSGVKRIILNFFKNLMLPNANIFFIYKKYNKLLKKYKTKMYLKYLESDCPGVKASVTSPEGKSSVDLISKSFNKIFTICDTVLSHMDLVIRILKK